VSLGEEQLVVSSTGRNLPWATIKSTFHHDLDGTCLAAQQINSKSLLLYYCI
jgi:hypothetical protein